LNVRDTGGIEPPPLAMGHHVCLRAPWYLRRLPSVVLCRIGHSVRHPALLGEEGRGSCPYQIASRCLSRLAQRAGYFL
jgi:hypothetical protein